MSVEQERPASIEFEQNYLAFIAPERAMKIKRDVLCLAETAIRFAAIERVPRYSETRRENDAEHSFMLGLVSQEIAASYFPELNTGLISQFCTVHDLIELCTNDTPTFTLSDIELAAKTATERSKTDELCSTLPTHTARLIKAYEEQACDEARFVRLIDKLLPVLVDILGPGSQVMHEDYGTFTHTKLKETEKTLSERYRKMFPESHLIPIHIARDALVRIFTMQFQPLAELQDALF